MRTKRMIVGISGASGMPLALALLDGMRAVPDWETHLVLSRAAERTLAHETELDPAAVRAMATHCHEPEDIGASIASGTFRTEGMIIVPCSMKSLAGMACGYAENLLLRAADVCLKEQRRLVLVVRESPLHALHLENMLKLARMGAVIMPFMPGFYMRPQGLDACVRQFAGRLMGFFGIEMPDMYHWRG